MNLRRGLGTPRLYMLLGAAALLVLVLALLLGTRRRNAAQNYMAELRARGEKLTYAELIRGRPAGTLQPQHVLTSNLALLANSLIQPAKLDYSSYQQPGRVKVIWKDPASLASMGNSPLTWEKLDEIMRQEEPALREIREVLKTAGPEWGMRTNALDGSLVSFVTIRQATQRLGCAMISELHQGRLEEALQDLEAIAALAHGNRSGLTLVSEMIRIAVGGFGLSATWQALQAPGWSDAQLERMQRAWGTLDMIAAVEEGLTGERAMGIELWERARRMTGNQLRRSIWSPAPGVRTRRTLQGTFEDYVLFPAYKLTSMDHDEVFYLKSLQECLQAVRAARAGQPWAFHSFQTNALFLKLKKLSAVQAFRYQFSFLVMPSCTGAIKTSIRNETLRQMTLTAIAIQRYQLKHHAPPPSLDVLVPEFLPQPTRDPMSGNALLYRPGTNGNWRLYSTGEDARDNSGNPAPSGGGARPGLWEGLDAVWPEAAEQVADRN